VAIGVGAGCIGLEATHRPGPVRRPADSARLVSRAAGRMSDTRATAAAAVAAQPPPLAQAEGRSQPAAVREFGPEQALLDGPSPRATPMAHASDRARQAGSHTVTVVARLAAAGFSPATNAARREFAP
jgi:hypothetical protein